MQNAKECNCHCGDGNFINTCFGCVDSSGIGTFNGVPYCYTLSSIGGSFSWNVLEENEEVHSSTFRQTDILTGDGPCPSGGKASPNRNYSNGVYYSADPTYQYTDYYFYQKNHWKMTDLSLIEGSVLKKHDAFFSASGGWCCSTYDEPLPEWEPCTGIDWYSEISNNVNYGVSAGCFWRNVSGPLKFFKQSTWQNSTNYIGSWNSYLKLLKDCCGIYRNNQSCVNRTLWDWCSEYPNACTACTGTYDCSGCVNPENTFTEVYISEKIREPKIEFYGDVDFGNNYYGISKSGDFFSVVDSGYDSTLSCSFSWPYTLDQFEKRSTQTNNFEKSLILNYNCDGCWTDLYDYDTKNGFWPTNYIHTPYDSGCQTFNPSGSIPNFNTHFLRNTIDLFVDFPDNTGYNFTQYFIVNIYSNYFNYRSFWADKKYIFPSKTEWSYRDGTESAPPEYLRTTCTGCIEFDTESYSPYEVFNWNLNPYPVGDSGCEDDRNKKYDFDEYNCNFPGGELSPDRYRGDIGLGLWSCKHEIDVCNRFAGTNLFGDDIFFEYASIKHGTLWSGVPPSLEDADEYHPNGKPGMLLASYYKKVDCAIDFSGGPIILDAVEDSGAGPFNTPQYMYGGYWNFPPQIKLTPQFCEPSGDGPLPTGGGPPPL